MVWRAAVVSALMLVGAAYLTAKSAPEPVAPRESFTTFPMGIGEWRGRQAEPFTADVLAVLGVDEHVNRIYRTDRALVGLYIGYYQSQRQGDTMHSPLNCLPGAGWQPIQRGYTSIDVAGGPIRVNEIVIQKGIDKQLVLYWYQSHGRVEPNEYWSKLFTIYDAVRLNRTDAAMVRVVIPFESDDLAPAAARAREFVQAMYPSLEKHLPL
jgi:EpsI family protein